MTNAEITTKLDRLVRWGYNSRKIDGKLLEGFQELITEVSGADDSREMFDTEKSLSEAAGTITVLQRALKMTGITPKGLERINQLDDDFLDWFDKHGFTINSELEFTAFLSLARGFDILCDTDLGNISYYGKLLQRAGGDTKGKFRPYLEFMRQLCPHLAKWFDQLEAGYKIDEIALNDELYQLHLNN